MLYDIPSVVISLGLFAAMLQAIYSAFLIGSRSQTTAIHGSLLGFSSGLAGSRPATPVYLMLALIVLLVFMISDLDRPRRGLIDVDQRPFAALLESMKPR